MSIDFPFLTLVFVGFFNLALGLFVFLLNPRGVTNQRLFIFTFALLIWMVLEALFHKYGTLFWADILWLGATPVATTLLLFARNFLEIKSATTLYFWFSAIGANLIIFLIYLLNPRFFITEVNIINSTPLPVEGGLYFLYTLYFAGGLGFSIWLFLKKYLVSSGRLRAYTAIVLTSVVLGALGGFSLNVVFLRLGYAAELFWLGPLVTLIAVLAFTYATFEYQGAKLSILPIEIIGVLVFVALLILILSTGDIGLKIFYGMILVGISIMGVFLIRGAIVEKNDAQRLRDLLERNKKINTELQRIDKNRAEFLAIASHHLRAPLTFMKWAIAEFLQGAYGSFSQEQTDFLRKLNERNNYLIGFINTLFDASRIETGGVILRPEETDLGTLIKDIVNNFQKKAQEHQLKLFLAMPETGIFLFSLDKELIQRALENIIDNALIYTSSQGAVRVSMAIANNQAIITVQDNGIGIPKEELSQVTQKFFRGSNARRISTEGTGLGLFIAKTIIEQHQGAITIDSQEGRGTTVRVTLPIKK